MVASSDGSKLPSILIVEDDALVATYIEAVIDEAGYQVVGIAASAAEALSLAAELRPALALLDIRLTGPIDGIELACLLREQQVPSVFLTGCDDYETARRARVARPLGFLAKPVRPSQIFKALEAAFERINGRI